MIKIWIPVFLQSLVLLSMSPPSAASGFNNESDLLALLDFKTLVKEDPRGAMKMWNGSFHFCTWFGVTCGPSNQRVAILTLENQRLLGSIPPSIGNLTRLTEINFRNNSFSGKIPPEIGCLLYLRVLDLNYNQLVGTIPDQLSSLTRLVVFGLARNHLTGNIPAWIGNFSSLTGLVLALNNLNGNLPNELGKLAKLERFILWDNNISGIIPPSIYNISSINYFTVAANQLEGKFPQDMGIKLPNLEVFACGVNKLTGKIPVSFSNASRLEVLDVSENSLTGPVPLELGSLKSLKWLDFSDNRLGSGEPGDLDVIDLLVNCTRLELLDVGRNFFGGEIPKSIANLSTQLISLTMGSNQLYGRIPFGIGNLANLSSLGLEGNSLGGNIPEELGRLNKLSKLNLNVNKFSGKIPYSLGNLTSLLRVFMEENRLEGSIPESLGKWQNLLVLNLSSNNLSGEIPRELMRISSLSISLTLSNNSLNGSLPSEVGELNNLAQLDVSRNKLTGEIPTNLGKCLSLVRLCLDNNEFSGEVPESLKSLRGLEYVDLSWNNLAGSIPEFLSELTSLKHLDLSRNSFEGEVSKEGIFANVSAFSVLGNDKLCGGVNELDLTKCSGKDENSRPLRISSRSVMIPVLSVAILVIILISIFYFCYKRKPQNLSSTEDGNHHISYSDLSESTNGFSPENLIGSGSFGSVYKGTHVLDREVVAVKVLNLQARGALKSFVDECEALRSVRHRNLLKIITSCSSIDRQGNEFRSLVFEFMANGNLDESLHGQRKSLSFAQRLDIAIDVASAMDYLHNYCQTPIVHCDLKPSNVLLDHNMVAVVSDFGLATFVFNESENNQRNETLTVALKGSIGYIPPEYGMGVKVSVCGDSYSFGILLLEMFTGRRPTDDFFKDGLCIRRFASTALPDRVMNITDPSLFPLEENRGCEVLAIMEAGKNHVNGGDPRIRELLVSVMRVGLSCSDDSPVERLLMSSAVKNMLEIKDSYLKFTSKN